MLKITNIYLKTWPILLANKVSDIDFQDRLIIHIIGDNPAGNICCKKR